jgi:hypothetical protein
MEGEEKKDQVIICFPLSNYLIPEEFSTPRDIFLRISRV